MSSNPAVRNRLSISLLCVSQLHVGSEVKSAEAVGVDGLHLDFIDGHVAPHYGLNNYLLRELENSTRLALEVHAMVEGISTLISSIPSAATILISLNEAAILAQMQQLPASVGIVLNAGEPLNAQTLCRLNPGKVTVLCTELGYIGRPFRRIALNTVSELVKARADHGLRFRIEADGGVGEGTMPSLLDVGCDDFVIGSTMLSRYGVYDSVVKARELINKDRGLAL